MKKALAMILCAMMLFGVTACETAPAEQPIDPAPVAEPVRAQQAGDKEIIYGENMTLTLYDEFDGEELNPAYWDFCPQSKRQDGGGYWDPSQVALADGKLVLTTVFDEEKGHHLSGAVQSRNIFTQAYGYFECSMKFQEALGHWSAFWIQSNHNNQKPGAEDGVEIDVIEAFNPIWKNVNMAAHWDGYDADHQVINQTERRPDLYDGEYHTFAFMWTEDMYIWYIDGEECWRTDEPGICSVEAYLRLTMEVGSNSGPINNEDLPDSAYVDYVRVYQFDGKLAEGGAA